MSRLAQRIVTFCVLALVARLETSLSAADVEVRLTDGRTLRGTLIESQTNRERLALELKSSGLTIRRTITLKQIAAVQVLAPHNKKDVREVVPAAPSETKLDRQSPESPPLAQLLVKAEPISTTGKIDWDSLRLTVRGVDINDEAVPLFGTLKVNLWGQRRVPPESNFVRHPFVTDANFGSRFLAAPSSSSAYQHPYVTAPNPVVELASWTQSIHGERDRVMVLPLPTMLPEHDVRVGAFGEVSVELLMPGVGVFAASDPDVVLSHQTLLRRERLDRDGLRFFPNELTTDSPQTTRSRNRFTWPGGVSGPERGILPIQP